MRTIQPKIPEIKEAQGIFENYDWLTFSRNSGKKKCGFRQMESVNTRQRDLFYGCTFHGLKGDKLLCGYKQMGVIL